MQAELLRADEALDPEPVLQFTSRLLENALPPWKAATSDERELLQQVMFPEGLVYQNPGGFVETGASALFFSYLPRNKGEISGMVAQTFASWNHIANWLRVLESLRRAA